MGKKKSKNVGEKKERKLQKLRKKCKKICPSLGTSSGKKKKGYDGKPKKKGTKHHPYSSTLKHGHGILKSGLRLGGLAASVMTGSTMPIRITGAAGQVLDAGSRALGDYFNSREGDDGDNPAMPTGASSSSGAPLLPADHFPKLKKSTITPQNLKIRKRKAKGGRAPYEG